MSSKAVLLAILIICVCAAVIAVHWPALAAQTLSFDDDQYLLNNALVKNPSWSSAWKFLSQVLEPSTVGGYYQPLAMISLMLDYSLGGRVENLMPFHRTSLALHAANTALIIVLLYLLFGEVWVAAAVGLLFGLHPMTVEPIPWVGERKTLLAAFFALWSLIFYLRYAHARAVVPARNVSRAKAGIQSPANRSTWGFYIACLFFYFLALMSKPTSTPLPVLMLLLDFWPLKRLKWQSFFEKIPFFILGGIFAVITYVSQTRTAGSTLPTEAGIWRISLILCHNIIFYLYKIIWPVNLSSHYPFPDPLNFSQPMVLAGVIGTCILIPLLLISLRWTRAAFTGWLFFFVAILPTMQIIGFSNVIASDKFAYIPSFGLLMLLAFFLCNLWNLRLKNSVISGSKYVVIILFVLILSSAESLATRSYLTHWRNSISFCEYIASKAPNAPILHYNLGVSYGELGRWREAIDEYKQAIRIKPDYADAHNNLGVAYNKLGRWQEAIEAFSQAIKIKKDYAEAHYNLGTAYGKLGRWQEAIDEYKQTIKIKPDYAEAHFNLGIVYGTLGRYQEAVESYKQAIRIKPDYNEDYNLGVNYYKLGRYQDAIEAYKQAIKIKPDFALAHYTLGVAYLAIGDKESARGEYKILKTMDAEQANKLFNLIYK